MDTAKPYPAIPVTPLAGDEPLTDGAITLTATVLDYWRWSSSDLVGNVSRGVLAEYLVSLAVGSTESPRDPWAAYDVVTPAGITVEVKSASYLQAWSQTALSRVSFATRATRPTIIEPGMPADASRRTDVWVFALLHHQDQETLNPLDVSQWAFWVLPTWWLNARTRSQHSITLPSLQASPFGIGATYGELASTIQERAELPQPNA